MKEIAIFLSINSFSVVLQIMLISSSLILCLKSFDNFILLLFLASLQNKLALFKIFCIVSFSDIGAAI